jgi:hypothetical protein
MLGLILLLVLVVDLLVIEFREPMLERLFVLLSEFERLLDGVLVLIVLPMRDVSLELILLLELLGDEAEELVRLLMLFRLDRFNADEFDRVVICRPNVLEFGAVERELIDRLVMDLLVMLLLGVRLVMDLLVMLLLGVRLVMDLLVMLLLGVRLVIDLLVLLLLVMALLEMLGDRLVMLLLDMLLLGILLVIDLLDELLLEMLLLGALLIVDRLELRLDETLLGRLDDGLDGALGAGAGLETLWLDRPGLRDLLLERLLAAKTGSQNNKRARNKQKTRKSKPP